MPTLTTVPPSSLLVDDQNPRIREHNVGQRRTIELMAEHLGPKLATLADDIVAFGLNPADLPIVAEAPDVPGRYIVLEGNRRIAALRVLENPEAIAGAASPAVLKSIRAASRRYLENPIDAVQCVVMSRDEARHWILLRHTGENQGAGLVPWGSDEVANYNALTRKPEPHLQVLNFLESRGDLDAETRRSVKTASLKRLIETPAVRERLGIVLRGGRIERIVDDDRVAKVLMHVVTDLVKERIKTADIYTKKQREIYAQGLPATVAVSPRTPRVEPAPLSASGGPPAKSATRPKGAPSSKPRERLITRDWAAPVSDKRCAQIAGELRKLSLVDHTNAVSVLLRVFLELSMDDYIDRFNLANVSEDSVLAQKFRAVAKDLQERKLLTSQQGKAVARACQADSFLAATVMMMHQYLHNKHMFPEPASLRAAWDSLQPFISAAWQRPRDSAGQP